MNILCIGNSFSVDTTWLAPQIAGDLGLDIHFGNLYVGGCSLNLHLEHLETDAPVYKFYESDGGEWTCREETAIAYAVKSRSWDCISIQAGTKDGSRYSKPESYEKLPRLVQLVKELAPGAKIVFNMTWVGDQNKPRSEMPEYRERLDDLYRDIATLTRDLVAPMVDQVLPTGTAIQNYRLNHDGPMCRDGYHLSYGLGRYVAALSFLKALTGCKLSKVRWMPEDMEPDQREQAVAAVEKALENPYAVEKMTGKTTLILVRHGESEANQRDAFLGHFDLPLTERGLAQARLAAAYLSTLPVDAIYSSDLKRAHQTSLETAKLLKLPVKTDANLREVDAGLWDNMTFAQLWETYPETFGIWANDIGNAGCDGGETTKQLRLRVMGALTYIARANRGKTVLVFCHGTPIRIAGCIGQGKPIEELKDVPWAANGSATTLEFENGSFRLVQYSREDYMGELVTKLPENV
jgi:broad specificity phosphatase PhoE